MINWLQEVLTLPIILAFIIGLLVSQTVAYLVERRRRQQGKPCKDTGWTTVVGVVIVAAMIWVMVATQQARNCAISLNVAVAQEQVIAKIERDSFAKAVIASQAIPPEIQDLPQSDPLRKKYFDPITDEYLGQTAKARKMREENQANQDAAQHACGR